MLPRSLSLDRAIQIAVEVNPRVAAAGREVGAAEGRLVQAGLWPNPSLELEAEDGLARNAAGFGGPNQFTATLSQPLPVWGRLGAREEVARGEIETARSELEAVRREVMTDVRLAFYRILSAAAAVSIARDGLEVADQLLAVAEDRVRSGAASEIERLRAQVERSKASVALSEAEAEYEQALVALRTAIGAPGAALDGVVGRLRGDLPEIRSEALEDAMRSSHPELAAASRRVELARAELALAKVEWLPEPEVDVGIGRVHEEDEHEVEGLLHDDHENEAVLEWGVTIPIPAFDRNQGRIAETAAQIEKARAEEGVVANRLAGELREAVVSFERARAQWSEYRSRFVPEAERALDLIRGGYKEGKFTQLEVLDSQRAVLEARLAQVARTREAIQALGRIQGLAGPEHSPDPMTSEGESP